METEDIKDKTNKSSTTNESIKYVDQFGNPIDPSLVDEFGNYIGPVVSKNNIAQSLSEAETVTNVETAPISVSEHQMDDKDMFDGMVTFDYNNVPITDIVNSIILDAINKGASDIHFDPFEDGLKIRIRIDGQLNDYSIVPLFVKRNMITRIKIISGMNITESRTPQDGAIRTELANKTIDLRVSCLPTNMGEKIVIRIMDYSMSALGVDALDFNEINLEKVKKMMSLPNGIILVTGATGTGKSTTVYSMLQGLNKEGTNLITVEDPIEMNIGGINQVQAAPDIGLTFANVLRSILRQDPDVIMIGEIRDDETARIAVRASITGHLVLSTIHTNNSLNTIERLTDMSVERYLLGTALSGIISQKLARRLCEKCRRLRPTNEYEKEIFKKALNKDVNEIYEPVGCQHCSKGYRGRIAIQEVLLLNQAIKDGITKGIEKRILRELVYGENGTETMLQDGLEKVIQGKTSFEEILKLIDLEDDLGTGTQLGMQEQMDASLMVQNINGILPNNNTASPINKNNNPVLTEQAKDKITSNQEIIEEEKINEYGYDNKLEQDTVETIDVSRLIDDPIETNSTDNRKDNILNKLYDKLLKTRNTLTKKKYKLHVKELLSDINSIKGPNEELPQNIIEYFKFISSNNIISADIKVELINYINNTFNLNIEIENNYNEPLVPVTEDKNGSAVKSKEEILNDLYDKLLRTRNTLTKQKYLIHVKEILNSIKNNLNKDDNIPTEIINYFNYIASSNVLPNNIKEEVISNVNNLFNLNIKIVMENNQAIENEDAIDKNNIIVDLSDEDIENLVPTDTTEISESVIDDILGLDEPIKENENIIDNKQIVQDIPNENKTEDNGKVNLSINELDNILESIDKTDIEEPISNINDENIENDVEEIDNISDEYDLIDDSIINSLLDNIEYDEEV